MCGSKKKIICINQALIQGKCSYVHKHGQPMYTNGQEIIKMKSNLMSQHEDETSQGYTNSVKGGRNQKMCCKTTQDDENQVKH